MFHVSQVAVPVLRDIGAAPRRGGFCSRERASLPADRALPNAGDRPAHLIVPGTHPGDGRIDGGFSAGAAPPSYPCGGRGGGAPCQPNVRTLKVVCSSSNEPHGDVLQRGNTQNRPHLELQREEDVVVVADDPPQLGASKIACGEAVHPIPFDHGVEAVIRPGVVSTRCRVPWKVSSRPVYSAAEAYLDRRPIILARWRRLPWRTRSAARSRQPTGGRTCSSAGAGSWMTGPATWPAGVEGRTDRLIGPDLGSVRWPSRQGSLWRERPPKRGGVVVDFGVHHLPLPGAAPAAKNRGSLPPLPPPPVRRHDAACEGVDTRCRRRTGLYPIGCGNPCQPASNADSRAQPGPRRRGLRPLRVERWGC